MFISQHPVQCAIINLIPPLAVVKGTLVFCIVLRAQLSC